MGSTGFRPNLQQRMTRLARVRAVTRARTRISPHQFPLCHCWLAVRPINIALRPFGGFLPNRPVNATRIRSYDPHHKRQIGSLERASHDLRSHLIMCQRILRENNQPRSIFIQTIDRMAGTADAFVRQITGHAIGQCSALMTLYRMRYHTGRFIQYQ